MLEDREAEKVLARLKASNYIRKMLYPRFTYTDKNDGVCRESKPMLLLANARLAVPGYQDEIAHVLRKDALTAARLSCCGMAFVERRREIGEGCLKKGTVEFTSPTSVMSFVFRLASGTWHR